MVHGSQASRICGCMVLVNHTVITVPSLQTGSEETASRARVRMRFATIDLDGEGCLGVELEGRRCRVTSPLHLF